MNAATEPRTVELAQIRDYGPGMTEAEVKAVLDEAVHFGTTWYVGHGLDGVRYGSAKVGRIAYRPATRSEALPIDGLKSMRAAAAITFYPPEPTVK